MDATEKLASMGRTSIQVSEELADELHRRKERGDSYEDVIWRALDEQRRPQPDSGAREPTPDEPPEVVHEPPQQMGEEPASHQDLQKRLEGELAGSGDLLERRVGEVVKMYNELMRLGTAEKDDLLAVVDVDATGYASPDSVWANMVKGKDTLRALPGVEKPSKGRTEWRYTGGEV